MSTVIYTRVSSPGQEQDGTSLDTQLAACRAHGADRRATIAETGTGTNGDEHSNPNTYRGRG